MAEELIDRAHFGDHPLGRTVLGPEDHLRTFSREAIVAFRERRWAGARGGAFVVGNVDHVPANGKVDELFARFPDLPAPEPYEPAPGLRPAGPRRAARLQPVAPADELPPGGRRRRPQGARRLHDLLHAAGRLDGLAPVRRDPRAARPVLLGLRRPTTPTPTCPSCSSAPASSRPSAPRPTRACARSSASWPPTGRREEEVERARAYAAGRRVLAFENTNAVARYAANQRIVFDEDIDPDAAIALLDAVTFDEVAEAARTVDPEQARRRLRRAARRRRVLDLVKASGRAAPGAVRMRSCRWPRPSTSASSPATSRA